MSFCPQCGAPNADDARFCEKCGTAVTGTVVPAAQPAQAPVAAAVTEQATAVVGAATAEVKKVNPLVLIGALVLVVLIGVGIVITRPMDKREYKKESENLAEDMVNATSRISSDIYELAYNYEDESDELDASDVQDLRDSFKKQSKKIKEAADGIKGLRPPSDYKDGDKDLRIWAEWMATDGLKQYDDAVKLAESDGTTYEDFNSALEDWQSDWDDSGEDAYQALEDAVDELNIQPYGQGE